jgi:lipid II:glycine glycyltransferase (peptidoglycan interpeptide bridge formation enzyme)
MDYEHKVRKNVMKAQRCGLRTELDFSGRRLDEFCDLYAATMARRSAESLYRLPRAYFEAICRELSGLYVFFHTLADERVVSSELVLISRDRVYSFLGGTDDRAFDMRPNDLLKHSVVLWARSAGKREFVLGGGYRVDDGIYRYKRAFAPRGVVPFFVGTRIFAPARYDVLVAAAGSRQGVDALRRRDYFPAYR